MTKTKLTGKKPLPGQMLDLIIGYWISQLIFVAAKLGLADQLKRGPRTAEQLAHTTGMHPVALARALRALASVGVFAEIHGGRYKLTPLASTLLADTPQSMRDFALMMVDDYNWRTWQELLESVRTEANMFPRVNQMRIFEYLQQNPEKGRLFARSMASISGMENPAVAAAGDFSKLRTLVDVGGSQGHLLAEVLRRNRRLKGILFDLPATVEQARGAPYLQAKGIVGRVELMGGDFFQSVPEGADGYMMKYILHDWDDAQCITILENCRRAMALGGRVLVIDTVIPAGNGPHWGKLLDIAMMVGTGGRERSAAEFKTLFTAAGLKLKRIIPTDSPLSIVEGSAG